ncbi:MAG: class C beta-lactamase-related serine hydrolase, partial [Pedobacter sp.]
WKYKSVDAILLGWALEQATGKTLPRYFEENIWHNIGSAYRASWGEDKKGMVNTASRFQASAADLAKLGKLFLQKGSFNGKQVLPASWIARSLSVPKGAEPIKKGWWKPSQQNLWWIPLKGSAEDYTAEGMLGQRLYVDPVTNTIIVQLAEKGAGDYPYRKIARYLAHKEFNYPE